MWTGPECDQLKKTSWVPSSQNERNVIIKKIKSIKTFFILICRLLASPAVNKIRSGASGLLIYSFITCPVGLDCCAQIIVCLAEGKWLFNLQLNEAAS